MMRNWIKLVEETSLTPSDMFRRDAIALRDRGALPSKFTLGHIDEHTVELISIYSEERGKGHGTTTMKALCELADKYEVTLELLPRSAVQYGWDDGDEDFDDALGQEALEEWYFGMGFDNDPYSDTDKSDMLIRLPHGAEHPWRSEA
jgi:hypothetical protein